jgi:hypothetical protein
MSVGLSQPSKAQIDALAGSLPMTLEDWIVRVERFQAFLAATLDATLTAAPYNYTAGEVAILKSAFTDFTQLIAIYRGSQNLASAKDFRAFSKQLIGTGN